MPNLRWAPFVLGMLLLDSASGFAQAQEKPTTPAMIEMQKLRAGVGVRNSLSILRQVDGQRPPHQLDELADSLAQFIVAEAGKPTTIDVVAHALEALGLAGGASGPGVPYAGASERLQAIAETSSSEAGGALLLLARSADRSDAVNRLRSMVIRNPRLAEEAIDQLDRNAGVEGVAALKALHARSSTLSPQSRRALKRVATKRQWPVGAPSP